MFNLFKKNSGLEIKAPISGNIIPIEEVKDQVFSKKMVGDGIAIEPSEGVVVSPIDGEIVQIFPTKHAVGLKTEDGIEILIHIGLDTVTMKGEGFESFIKAGDKVKVGQKLVTFDIGLINEKAESTVSPVLITNYKDMKKIDKLSGVVIKGEDTILKVSK